jgi:hypothetical protein
MGPVPGTIRRTRVCDLAPSFGHTLIRAPRHLDFSHLLVNKSRNRRKKIRFKLFQHVVRNTWEHMGVRAGAV